MRIKPLSMTLPYHAGVAQILLGLGYLQIGVTS
jgi:hypothetical protein